LVTVTVRNGVATLAGKVRKDKAVECVMVVQQAGPGKIENRLVFER